jgi:hypothetical protein
MAQSTPLAATVSMTSAAALVRLIRSLITCTLGGAPRQTVILGGVASAPPAYEACALVVAVRDAVLRREPVVVLALAVA